MTSPAWALDDLDADTLQWLDWMVGWDADAMARLAAFVDAAEHDPTRPHGDGDDHAKRDAAIDRLGETMRIEWDRAEVQAVYEDMVSVLIKRLHPDVQRVDGSGGDGGRDLQLRTADGLVVYELKSFAGRLNQGGRKRQISRSLRTASKLKPVQWHLVAPVDLTPAERQWFDGLAGTTDFECSWRGKTWLDSEMAKRPDIKRYYVEDGNKEVIDCLRQLQTDWDPGDALSTAARVGDMRTRLNDHDPHYRYDLSVGSVEHAPAGGVVLSAIQGDTRVDVRPRYATAVDDRPITVTISIDDQDAETREDFQRALDSGDEVVLPLGTVTASLDAPGGLGGQYTGGGLRMIGIDQDLDDELLIEAAILDPDRREVLSRLEFDATTRRSGRRQVAIQASDASGLVSVELVAQQGSDRLRANFSFQLQDVLPSVGVPPARWMEHLRGQNYLQLMVNGKSAADPIQLGEPLVPEGPLKLFEAFHAVQEHAGLSFPVPGDIAPEEWKAIHQASQLLQLDGVRLRWQEISFQIHEAGFVKLGEDLESDRRWRLDQEAVLPFRRRSLDMGRLITEIDGHLADPDAVRAAFGQSYEVVDATIRAGESNDGRQWLVKH